jgi:hypothetical protein
VKTTKSILLLHVELTAEVKHTLDSFTLTFDLVSEVTLDATTYSSTELKISAGDAPLSCSKNCP